ncbi:hypothetical protein K466DRAFT_190260 [Polyporus arcularius HHB13444]|uniref:Uncharacterized protein n=1 Tax=Polyporus arcularius HHB13444 TaxID=1314778 RepID=A0A5C3P9S1_9APHY|nr:hypothetical protein K466DRAFT_190260 [Polyporus arcularius HHB13444]
MGQIMDGLPFPEFASALPITDRQSLSGLSDFETRSWTVARADEYRKFALALLAIHNSIAAIHRFPNEILSHILADCWKDRNSLRIAHVCRRWRGALLATPEFWVDAVEGEYLYADGQYRDPPEYVATILNRSTPLPMRLDVVHFTRTLAEDLDSHLWRITTLAIDVETSDEVIWLLDILRRGMPVLERLIVQYEPKECDCSLEDRVWHETSLDVDPVPLIALPRLRHAELPACLMEKVAVPSLRRVRLYRDRMSDHDNPEANMDNFLPALARCEGLASLELVTALPDPGREYGTTSPEELAVTLPALQSFSIKDGLSQISAIMTYLISPSIAHVRVQSNHYHYDSLPCGLTKWLRPTSLMNTVLAGVDCVAVTFRDCTVLQCYAEGDERLYIEYCIMGEDFEALADALRTRATVTELRWTSTKSYAHEEHGLCLLLCASQHITSLVIRGAEAEAALNVLRPADGIAAQGLVCPCLKELTLGFLDFWYWMSQVQDGTLPPDEATRQLFMRCAQIQSAIGPRASLFGSRLTYLEFDEKA